MPFQELLVPALGAFAVAFLFISWISSGDWDIFDPRLWLTGSVFVGAVLRPVYFFNVDGQTVHAATKPIPVAAMVSAAGLTVAAVVALQAGYHLAVGHKLSVSLRRRAAKWRSMKAWLLIAVLSAIGLWGSYIELQAKARIALLGFEGRSGPMPTEYIKLARTLMITALTLALIDIFSRDKLMSTWRIALTAAIFFVAFMVPVLTGSRSNAMAVLLVPVIFYHYLYKRISLFKAIALALPLMVFIVGLGKARGTGDISDLWNFNLYQTDFVVKYVDSHKFYDMPTVARVIAQTPEDLRYQYGVTLIRWLTVPIPRSIWPDKPVTLGQVIGEHIYDRGVGIIGGGVPPSLIGELYLNFHVPGVIIGMLFYGVGLRIGHKYFARYTQNPVRIGIYSGFLLFVFSAFMGQLSNSMVNFGMRLLPLLISVLLAGGSLAREPR